MKKLLQLSTIYYLLSVNNLIYSTEHLDGLNEINQPLSRLISEISEKKMNQVTNP